MPKDLKEIFEKGQRLFYKNKFEEALKIFTDLINENPKLAQAWLWKGKVCTKLNSYNEAVKNFNKAIELKPSNLEAWIKKLEVFLHIETYEKILQFCESALSIHPEKFLVHVAYVHEWFKNYEKALEYVELALKYDSNDQNKRLKFAMLNAIKYGLHYYIPIARLKELLDFIPPEEDIIYCTRMIIVWERGYEDETVIKHRFGVKQFAIPVRNFVATTGVIITVKGIYWIHPWSKIFVEGTSTLTMDVGNHFIPWGNVVYTSNGEMKLEGIFNCKLEKYPRFETEESFQQRFDSFHNDLNKLRYQFTLECLERVKNRQKNDSKEALLQLIELALSSNLKQQEFDLSEDLTNFKIEISNQMRKESENINKNLEILIVSHLKSNPGNAFTLMSLIKRLKDDIIDPNTLEYLEKNAEGFLNSLIYNKKIMSVKKDTEVYYFI